MQASPVTATLVESHDPRLPRRVRHETLRRLLTVTKTERVTPNLVRVTLGGEELRGFTSLGFDDHVKVMLPAPGADRPVLPTQGSDGPVYPEGVVRPEMRDYTPRRYDPVANTLEIDFVLHDAGPATHWAAQARVGQYLGIGGPRGSFIIPTTYDWHLLIGDDTALPAIARRLAELPAGARAVVLAEVDKPSDQLAFESQAEVSVTWAHRNGVAPGASNVLSQTLKSLVLPKGDYYGWVACESLIAKVLRGQLIADHGANPKWLKAAGYWRRGAVAIHDTHND